MKYTKCFTKKILQWIYSYYKFYFYIEYLFDYLKLKKISPVESAYHNAIDVSRQIDEMVIFFIIF